MAVPAENIQPQSEQKNDKEFNFQQQRKMYERQMEQQKQEYEQRLQALEQQKQTHREDDSDDDNGEPYVDKKTLKKQLASWEKTIDQKIDKKAEEKARFLVEQERQSNFLKQNPDFNQILNADHIHKFAEKYPEIAEPMLEMPEGFARQKLLYQQIKALAVHKPPEPPKSNIQESINNNRKNMFYQPSGISTPPISNDSDFSPQGQKEAYDRVQALIKGRRGG